MTPVLCVDLGSTYTKAALVDPRDGRLLGTAQHPTTLGTDVAEGLDACREELGSRDAELLVCSSAGGGLRLAVVGSEELVTAEAGRRVALSSGGHVVACVGGGLDAAGVDALRAAAPDVLLLVGGTDGGNSAPLRADARALAASGWAVPVVLAGDAEAAEEVRTTLAAAGVPVQVAANVLPRIGVLAPGSARGAIREAFLRHVIGGKGLSRRLDLARLVAGPTPDVVLAGVEVLARVVGCDVAVVDVGGATTDVHSSVRLHPETHAGAEKGSGGLSRDVVAPAPLTRTVEGDLGMRWSAEPTARPGGLLVGSGGVLRHADAEAAGDLLAGLTGHQAEGWQLPDRPRVLVDRDYVLAAAGLLAQGHPVAARGLAAGLLEG